VAKSRQQKIIKGSSSRDRGNPFQTPTCCAPALPYSAPPCSLAAPSCSLDALSRSLGAPSKSALLPFPSRNGNPNPKFGVYIIYIYFLSLFYFLSFQRSLGFFLTSIDFLLCGNHWEKPLLRVHLSYVIWVICGGTVHSKTIAHPPRSASFHHLQYTIAFYIDMENYILASELT